MFSERFGLWAVIYNDKSIVYISRANLKQKVKAP